MLDFSGLSFQTPLIAGVASCATADEASSSTKAMRAMRALMKSDRLAENETHVPDGRRTRTCARGRPRGAVDSSHAAGRGERRAVSQMAAHLARVEESARR